MQLHWVFHRAPVVFAFSLLLEGNVWGRELRQLMDLKGLWRFEIGDDKKWADPGFKDASWETIKVPGAWEDQGYPGYDGYAWYRRHFTASPQWKGEVLYLRLGHLDDVDEVYVNGNFIGFRGQFPPDYISMYQDQREYYLRESVLNSDGDNVIAVRMYDGQMAGGMLSGDYGIYKDVAPLKPDIPLAGTWKFATGDDQSRKEIAFDDRSWKDVLVPAWWETQGFLDYDGFAWYRKTFRVPAESITGTQTLMLGKIDDYDEAYLNGVLVGRTGRVSPLRYKGPSEKEYLMIRAYTIPPGLLFRDKDNVLAVRVFDGYIHGGIYDGPVGIVSREKYLIWSKNEKSAPGILRRLLEQLFR